MGLTVTVRSSRNFMGFLLQARSVEKPGLSTKPPRYRVRSVRTGPVLVGGSWMLTPPGTHSICCLSDGDTVTHSDKRLKRNLLFVWRAPDVPMGDVRFYITVVQSYFVYWTGIRSPVLHDGSRSHWKESSISMLQAWISDQVSSKVTVDETTLRPSKDIGGTTSYIKDFNTDSPVTLASVLFKNVTNVNENNTVNYQSGMNEFGFGGFVRPESNSVLTKDKATQTNTEDNTSLGFASNLSPIIDSTIFETKETTAAATVFPNTTNSISMLYTLFKDVEMETSKPLAKYSFQTTTSRVPKILNKTVSNQDKMVTEQFEDHRSLKQALKGSFRKSQMSPKPEFGKKSVTKDNKQKSSPNSTLEPNISIINTLDTLVSATNKNFQTHFPFTFTEQDNDKSLLEKSKPTDSPSTAKAKQSQGNSYQTPTPGISTLSNFPTTTPIGSQGQTSLEEKSEFKQPIKDTSTQSWPEIHPPTKSSPIEPLSEQHKSLVTSQTFRYLPLTSKLARIFTPDKDIQDLPSFSAVESTTDVLSLGKAAQSLVTQSTKSPTYSLVSSDILRSYTTSSKDVVFRNPSLVHSSIISASKLHRYFTNVSNNTTPGLTNPFITPSLTSDSHQRFINASKSTTIGPTNPLLIRNLHKAAFVSHPKSVTTSPPNVSPSEGPTLFPTNPDSVHLSTILSTSQNTSTNSIANTPTVQTRPSSTLFPSIYRSNFHDRATTVSKDTTTVPAGLHLINSSPRFQHEPINSSEGTTIVPTIRSTIFDDSSGNRSISASKGATLLQTSPLVNRSSNSHYRTAISNEDSSTSLRSPSSVRSFTFRQRSTPFEGRTAQTNPLLISSFSVFTTSFHHRPNISSEVMSIVPTNPSPIFPSAHALKGTTIVTSPLSIWSSFTTSSKDTEPPSKPSSITNSRSSTALKGITTVLTRNKAFTFAATNLYNRLATSSKGTSTVPTSSANHSSFLVRFSLKSNGTSPLVIHTSTGAASTSLQTLSIEARKSIDPTSLSANHSLISSTRTSHGSNLASKDKTTDPTRQFSSFTNPPNIFYQRLSTEGSTSKVLTSQSTIPFPFTVSNSGLRAKLIRKGKITATTSFKSTNISPSANLSLFSAFKATSSPTSKGVTNGLSLFNSSTKTFANSHQRSATKGSTSILPGETVDLTILSNPSTVAATKSYLRSTIKDTFIFPTRQSTIQSFSTYNTRTRSSIVSKSTVIVTTSPLTINTSSAIVFTISQALEGTMIPASSPTTVATASKSISSRPINPLIGFSSTISYQTRTIVSKDTNRAQTNSSLIHSSTNNYHPTSINTSKNSAIVPTSPMPIPSSSIAATNSRYRSIPIFHTSTNLPKGAKVPPTSFQSSSIVTLSFSSQTLPNYLHKTTSSASSPSSNPSSGSLPSIKTPSTSFNHRPSAARRSFFNPITSTLPESKQTLVPQQKNHDAKLNLPVSRSVVAQNTDQNHKIGNNKPNVETKAKLPPNPPPDRNGKYPDIVPRHSAWELGMLLGSSAGLGMVLVVGVRYVYRQACGKRTEVTLPDREREYSRGERGLIQVQECGDLVRVRRIRENSFVLLAEYDILATPGD